MKKKRSSNYSCPYCLMTVKAENKARHLKSKVHIYNKKNTIIIRSAKGKEHVSKMMESAREQGKAFHLFVKNDKVADVRIVLGKKEN